ASARASSGWRAERVAVSGAVDRTPHYFASAAAAAPRIRGEEGAMRAGGGRVRGGVHVVERSAQRLGVRLDAGSGGARHAGERDAGDTEGNGAEKQRTAGQRSHGNPPALAMRRIVHAPGRTDSRKPQGIWQ